MDSLPGQKIGQHCPSRAADGSQNNCKGSKTGWFFARKVKVVIGVLPKLLCLFEIDARQHLSDFFDFIITTAKRTKGFLFPKKNRDTPNPDKHAHTGDKWMPPNEDVVKNSLPKGTRTEGFQSSQQEQTARTFKQASVKDNAFNSRASFQGLLSDADNFPQGRVPPKPECYATEGDIGMPVKHESEIDPLMVKGAGSVTVSVPSPPSPPSPVVKTKKATPFAKSEVRFSVTDQTEESCERNVSKKPCETVRFQIANDNGVVAKESTEVKVDSSELFEVPEVSAKPIQMSQTSERDVFSEVEKLYSKLEIKARKTHDYWKSISIRDEFVEFIVSHRHVLKHESVDRKIRLREMLFQLVGHCTLCSTIEGQHNSIFKKGSRLGLGLLARDYIQITKPKTAPYYSTSAPSMLGCSAMAGRNEVFLECFLIKAHSKGDIEHEIKGCADRMERMRKEGKECSDGQLNEFKGKLKGLNDDLSKPGVIDLDKSSLTVEGIAEGLVMDIVMPSLEKYIDMNKRASVVAMTDKILKSLNELKGKQNKKTSPNQKSENSEKNKAEAIRKKEETDELRGCLNKWFERSIENSAKVKPKFSS